MNQTATYDLTLCHQDGTKMAVFPTSPALPRWVHLSDDAIELSDSAEPEHTALHVETFARVGGSVWVDNNRFALYVRTTS